MWLRLLCAALVELIYCVATRAWLPDRYQGIELELLVTAGRLISLLAFFLLFKDLVLRRAPQPRSFFHPLAVLSLVLFLAAPVAVGNYSLPSLTAQTVFAVTSVVVALKEEFLYRGVLQNLLQERLSLLWAVVVSNVVFTLYHYGAQPFTAWTLAEIFAAGCFLGLFYAVTGSLTLVVVIHALNDAIWSFTPILEAPLPRPIGSMLLLSALGFCAMWALRSNHVFQRR